MYYKDNYQDVPERLLLALDRHAQEGGETGDFIRSVLENNLMAAVSHADPETMRALRKIVMYVVNELPIGCHGSPEIVKRWKQERKAGAK